MLFLQFLVNGLTTGALYALMAVGFAIIYNGTRILHLAHGAVFTFAGYMMYLCSVVLGLPVVVAFLLSVAATAVVGALCEILVYRPLRRAGSRPTADLVASIGLLTLLEALFALVFTTDTKTLHEGSLSTYEVGVIIVTNLHLIILAVAAIVVPCLQLFLAHSKYGRAMRALADNPALAGVLGVDTRKLYVLIFLLGSALAAVAACLISYDVGVRPQMGVSIMFIALVAVIVGGIGYLPGAAAGGLLLGLLEQVGLWYLSARWEDVVVFVVLLVFLILRPQGMFGGRIITRRA